MKKTGRNEKCPCGSGKKYKKCCLKFEVPYEVSKKFKEQEIHERHRIEKYGQVRPIIHADFKGNKFVAVGDQLYHSPKWKTFPDFLINYATGALGCDWGNDELKKPFIERHQILKWYDGMCRFQSQQVKGGDGLYFAVPNGAFAAFINLAYDLYILKDHLSLQEKVVDRLKDKKQFQGARYELFVAATCIKAGFDIDYEDETDVSKKHPEFKAVHRYTGQVISVEAKSRHRHGVLDYYDQNQTQNGNNKANIGKLLNAALQKPTDYPYVIFIDLNLPPYPGNIPESPWFEEIQKTIDFVCGEKQEKPDKFNLLILTNHPQHYGNDFESAPKNNTLMVLPEKSRNIADYPENIIEIYNQADKYGNIPGFFTD